MTNTIQSAAAAALAEVEKVTATILPEPGKELIVLDTATPAQAADIKTRMDEIDMTNTQSIISFGSSAE